MAKGPRHSKPLRRRAEGKTNYHKRLRLLKSKKIRSTIRASNNHIIIQFIQSKFGGDKILIDANSNELKKKYDWNANTGNIPAAYLTGYLAGTRAKNNKIKDAILDLGLFYHQNRVLAAIKGIIDAGIEIPYREEFFPENLTERINASHIENYAKLLKKEDNEKYQKIFSGYLKKENLNPERLKDVFNKSLQEIKSQVKS